MPVRGTGTGRRLGLAFPSRTGYDVRYCWCPELTEAGTPCRVVAEILREEWDRDSEGGWIQRFVIECPVHRNLTPMGWQIVEMD